MTEISSYVNCPCCNLPTLTESSAYEICCICCWEDDGQNDLNIDKILGGPNGNYSLLEARNNFNKYNCMYKETDLLFPTNQDYIELRNKIIKNYNQIVKTGFNETLLATTKKLESKLFLTPKRKS